MCLPPDRDPNISWNIGLLLLPDLLEALLQIFIVFFLQLRIARAAIEPNDGRPAASVRNS
jgi:hypothetical protein